MMEIEPKPHDELLKDFTSVYSPRSVVPDDQGRVEDEASLSLSFACAGRKVKLYGLPTGEDGDPSALHLSTTIMGLKSLVTIDFAKKSSFRVSDIKECSSWPATTRITVDQNYDAVVVTRVPSESHVDAEALRIFIIAWIEDIEKKTRHDVEFITAYRRKIGTISTSIILLLCIGIVIDLWVFLR